LALAQLARSVAVPLPLHGALPISRRVFGIDLQMAAVQPFGFECLAYITTEAVVSHPAQPAHPKAQARESNGHIGVGTGNPPLELDRKSTRLNSSHVSISYAVFCLK